jgi:hypothetical protein
MEAVITNGHLKIRNPQLQDSTFFVYNGPIDGFEFEKTMPSQLNNYNALTTLLNSQNIHPTEINIVRWNSPKGGGGRSKFIMKTTDPELLWYKSESNARGSGHNHIYYKKQKIKTTTFLSWDAAKLAELFGKIAIVI